MSDTCVEIGTIMNDLLLNEYYIKYTRIIDSRFGNF